MTSQELNAKVWEALRKRYPGTEYGLLREVRNAAGYNANRAADGVVVGFWPSRGLNVTGLEVKIHRSDWLRELKKPEKAEDIFQYCDAWYLVTGTDAVAKLEEIPAAWGWIQLQGSRLITMKEAPKLEPQPISRNFLASLMKRATTGMVDQEEINTKVEAQLETRRQQWEQQSQGVRSRAQSDLEELQHRVRTFEEAAGFTITTWRDSPRDLGETIRTLTDLGHQRILERVRGMVTQVQSMEQTISTALAVLENQLKPPTGGDTPAAP